MLNTTYDSYTSPCFLLSTAEQCGFVAQDTIQGHCKGCFRSKSPVPPFTSFPTTKQAEGEFNLSYKPVKQNK